MAYGRRSDSSILDSFTLSPLPYPVLLILVVVLLLQGISWFFDYESFVESTEEQMSWVLLVIPLILIIIIQWLSSIEDTYGGFGPLYPYDQRRRINYDRPQEGSSPWGVAAVVVLLLILVSFQSSFQDMWNP